MREITYYRATLALPLLSPFVCWALAQAGWLPDFVGWLNAVMFIGAIPYLLALVSFGTASVKLSEKTFTRYWHFAPFTIALAVIVTIIAAYIYHYVTDIGASGKQNGFGFADLAGVCMVVGIYCVAIGYVFVAIAKVLLWILKALNLVEAPRRDAFAQGALKVSRKLR